MIKVRATVRDGLFHISMSGHARRDVCSGASMICQSAALGLRDLAKQWPREIEFEAEGFFDSKDRRKRK